MNRKTLNSIFILLMLLAISACNAPGDLHLTATAARQQTEDSLMATMVETMRVLPSETPTMTPSATAAPTESPSETPYLWTQTPEFTPTLSEDYFHGQLMYEDVPLVSQFGLTYNGIEMNNGCTAAALQMLLDFWHAYNEDYPTMTAQGILNKNIEQNRFNPATGLNITVTEDELEDMDYHLGEQRNSNKEDLLAALERYGPLLIICKVNWNPEAANHMTLLTGWDEESDSVTINDPWLAEELTMTYNQFDYIWGLNYSGEGYTDLRRMFFFVVPESEIRPSGIDLFIP